MRHLTLKVVVAAVIVAGMLGGATAGFGRKKLTYLKPIAGGSITAFAAYVAINVLHMLQRMKTDMRWVAEKCSYIEQRIDGASAKSEDICRHLQQIFLEFDAEKHAAKTKESKLWWVERGLRKLYEDFSNSKAMQNCSYEVVKKTWSMLLLNVKIKTLRNAVALRHFGEKDGEEYKGMEWALKNMEAAVGQCSLWTPMELNVLENHQVQSCFEEILVSDIGEKMKEMKQYLEGDVSLKFAGLKLEGLTAASSNA